ncbi:MAG: NYN domain-containing protein [Saprospiraceae bacterium]
MESIIIDAYNLIHRIDELRILLEQSQDVCVDTMIAKLSSHYLDKKIKVIIAFDGYGINRHERNIEVKFSKTDTGMDYGNADGYIKAMIEKSRNPKLMVIVSSDKGITWFAKDCGCKNKTSESFWGEVRDKRIERITAHRESKEKPDILTKGEFDYFLKEFTK